MEIVYHRPPPWTNFHFEWEAFYPFILSFSNEDFSAFQIISGNTDTETVVSHRLMPTVYASKIRILPYSVHRRTVCLRVEIKGCLAEGKLFIPFYVISIIK